MPGQFLYRTAGVCPGEEGTSFAKALTSIQPLDTGSPLLQWALRDILGLPKAPCALVKFQARPVPQGPTVLGEAGLPECVSEPWLEEGLEDSEWCKELRDTPQRAARCLAI